MSHGRSRAWADGRSPHSRGSRRLQAPSSVAQADGGDGEDQPGGVEEATDDRQLDEGADDQGGDQPGPERHPVVPAPEGDQVHPERGRDATQVGLGEVDDPVGPVDQRQAEGGEGAEQTDDEAPQEDPGRARGRRPAGRRGRPRAARNGAAARATPPCQPPRSPCRAHRSAAEVPRTPAPARTTVARHDEATGSTGMKVDGGLGAIAQAGATAQSLEAAGYDGAWSAETSHDPFLPHVLAAEATEPARAGHRHRGGLRPQPDDAGQHGLGPAGAVRGPLPARPRLPDQAPHHQALLHAVVPARGADAGDDPGHPGHLGLLGRRRQARLPGRLLHPHPDDPVLQPRTQPPRPPQGVPRRRRRPHDRGGRRGGRRPPVPRLHHRVLPAGTDPAGASRPASTKAGRSRSDLELSHPGVRRHRRRTRTRWPRRPPASAARSPSTAPRRPTGGCSSTTAGAICRTSSTACPSRASGRPWAS